MQISEARAYIGEQCCVTWRDRLGKEQQSVLRVDDLMFVPMYGTYLVGDGEELHLEKVTGITRLE